MIGKAFEVTWACGEEQVLESADSVGDDLEEWLVGIQDPLQFQADRGGLRAFEVDTRFFGVHTVKIGP